MPLYFDNYAAARKHILNAATPFELLGVHRNSDEAAIKQARRSIAQIVHPDRNIGNEAEALELTSRLNVAVDVLLHHQTMYLAEMKGHVTDCPVCHSTGVKYVQRGFTERIESICPNCKGAGFLHK